MIQLIEEMLFQGHTYVGCPEYIPYMWITELILLFIVIFTVKSLIDLVWK